MSTYLWSDNEIQILKENYDKLTCRELSKLLPGRGIDSIQSKARKIGLQSGWFTWTKDEVKILKDNWGRLSSYKIVELIPSKSRSAIRNKAFILGLKVWSDKEIEILKKLYPTIKTKKEVSVLLPDKSLSSIQHKVVRLGIKSSRFYEVTDTFFSNPTPLSAYWAGFIAGDGCVRQTKSGSYQLSINLSFKDRKQLERFKDNIGFTGPISSYLVENRKFSRINIHSKQILNDLKVHYNITPRKSLTLRPPNIEDIDLIKPYLCGLIDTDGSIRRNGGGYIEITFLGTQELLIWIKTFVDKYAPHQIYSLRKTGRVSSIIKVADSKIFLYKTSGARAEKLLSWLDEVDIPKMPRKWNIYYNYSI